MRARSTDFPPHDGQPDAPDRHHRTVFPVVALLRTAGLFAGGHPVDTAVEVGHVKLAGRVLAEGANAQAGFDRVGCNPVAVAVLPHAPRQTGAVVGEEVDALQLGDTLAAVNVSAHHRAAEIVRVLVNRQLQPVHVALCAAAVTLGSFHQYPAEVGPGFARGEEIDLLVRSAADVADPEISRFAVEAKAPRVAQPVRPNLRRDAFLTHKRVVFGDSVRVAAIDVDPQNA